MQKPEVLAIDDDTAFAGSLKTYFEHHGIPVSTISDAVAAAAINYETFKVVLLDLDMPVISGQEVLRKIPQENRPLVIILSGHSDLATRMQLLDSGADFFLSKPADLREIYLIVKRALGRPSSLPERAGCWVLSRSKMALTTPSGVTIGLAGSEFRVLERLILDAPEPASKAALALAAAGKTQAVGANYIRSLEVMISRMRTRFGSESDTLPIKSLRNLGYVFHGNGGVVD